MRIIVIGLGVQGKKRRLFSGSDYVASVDPINPEADYLRIEEVPIAHYDAALVCLPDEPKYEVIKYLLSHGKHVLVEKPLWAPKREQLLELQFLAKRNRLVLYTAYNHRFEPHIKTVANLLQEKVLGTVYRCRLFYGNGTARDARNSAWRDTGSGVIADLCSHLLDFVDYWFDQRGSDYYCIDVQQHENRSPDHAIILNNTGEIKLTFEVSLLSWRNSFYCDIIGEQGSLHIDSFCKWGPSQFIRRERVFPSGRPKEHRVTLTQEDPTWALEYKHFKSLVQSCSFEGVDKDLWIYDQLEHLTQSAFQKSEECFV